MKLALGSDLHIEFGDLEVTNKHDADVLILSGDIVLAKELTQFDPTGILELGKDGQRFMSFFEQCSRLYKDVIYVMGNHEHYNGDFARSADILRKVCNHFGNIHFLDRDVKTIGDVTFIGGTLWTDMNKEDSLTLYHIKQGMNDFQIVTDSRNPVHYRDQDGNFQTRTSRFSPESAVEEHKLMLQYISTVVEGKHDQKFVVVGHHAPSKQSTKPRYQNDTLMNGGYSSDLSEFILDRPQIKLWTHGHTHDNFDYMIGTTRIVCNPRGYINYEASAYDFEFKLLEV
jgi:Icc-related predicted phosphoesterase